MALIAGGDAAVADEQDSSIARARSRVGAVWWQELLVVLGLTGFAISQPLLSLLSENPTVFTSHGVEGAWLVAFALGVALIPPVALWALGMVVTAANRVAGLVVHLATVAALATVTAIQALKALGLEQTALVAVFGLAFGVGLTAAYHRYRTVGTWLRFTAILPALALFLFLVASPTGDLLRGRDSSTTADSTNQPPVVMILLDELPTKSILATDGGVDATRFPNLAEFAGDATWYRHHTTVAPSTQFAVPALLTGSLPNDVAPLWTEYPDSLFSLLAPTHDLVAFESVTEMCGLTSCSEGTAASRRLGELVDTTADLYRERISPAPNKGERLDTFEENVAPTSTPDDGSSPPGLFDTERAVAQLERASSFSESLEPTGTRPTFYFLHLVLPHLPWRFYPDGQTYEAKAPGSYPPFAPENDQGEWLAALTEQRHLMQAQYADAVVGGLMDDLRANDLYEDSLVIVMSDHGISFELDTTTRRLQEGSDEGIDALAYSPLFIKPPGQTEGSIVDDNVMSVDLVPTVADLLGLGLEFAVDGEVIGSTEAAARGDQKLFVDVQGGMTDKGFRGLREYPDDFAPSAADRWIGPLDTTADPLSPLYERFGLSDLIGRPIDEMITAEGGLAVVPLLGTPGDGGIPLGTFVGTIVSPQVDEGVVVAAVDGTTVAAAPLQTYKDKDRRFILLFPPGPAPDERTRFALVTDAGVTELSTQ